MLSVARQGEAVAEGVEGMVIALGAGGGVSLRRSGAVKALSSPRLDRCGVSSPTGASLPPPPPPVDAASEALPIVPANETCLTLPPLALKLLKVAVLSSAAPPLSMLLSVSPRLALRCEASRWGEATDAWPEDLKRRCRMGPPPPEAGGTTAPSTVCCCSTCMPVGDPSEISGGGEA